MGAPPAWWRTSNGYLKAVWLDLWRCIFEVWPAPGALEGLQKCGGRSLPPFARPSRAPGGRPGFKNAPNKSGQTAFRPLICHLLPPPKVEFECHIFLTILKCGSGPESGHETALELVSGANFGCVLHQLSSPTRWNGSRGQVRPETGQTPNTNYMFDYLF